MVSSLGFWLIDVLVSLSVSFSYQALCIVWYFVTRSLNYTIKKENFERMSFFEKKEKEYSHEEGKVRYEIVCIELLDVAEFIMRYCASH